MSFVSIKPEDIKDNVIDLINRQWMLITAGGSEDFNMMTASWGGLGELWHKPVATIYVRPNRYTYDFIEKNEYFTLSFFDENFRKELNYCGKVSGKDEDKAAVCGFTTAVSKEGAVYFQEARLVIICKKRYGEFLKEEGFCDGIVPETYKNEPIHKMYIGEIVEVLSK